MEEALQIQSITGVDVDFKIAGPGGRSYAFVVDWHIRLLLALAWFVLATLLMAGTLNLTDVEYGSSSGFVFVVVLPATAIYFLYHPVLEIAMQGRTPGKRIAGIRIVTQRGEVPGVGALLIRNVLRLVDSLPGVYAVGLAATMFTDQSVRIGDMAAGTLLVYEDGAAAAGTTDAFAETSADAIAKIGLENLQLVQELIDRWDDLQAATRVELGNALLARLGAELSEGGKLESEVSILDALNRIRIEGR